MVMQATDITSKSNAVQLL